MSYRGDAPRFDQSLPNSVLSRGQWGSFKLARDQACPSGQTSMPTT